MALPTPFNPDAIDLPTGTHAPTLTLDAPSILTGETTATMPTLNLGDTVLLQGQTQALHSMAHRDSFDPGAVTTITDVFPPAPHITIVASFDTSVTTSSVAQNYESAVASAISYFESEITNPITVDINFGWGEVGGSTIDGALGESNTQFLDYTYGQVYSAVTGLAGQSAVQQAAYASLPTSDPTGGATFELATAQAAALGLQSNTGNGGDGSVGLDSSSQSPFFWS